MPGPLNIPPSLLKSLQGVPGFDEAAFLHAHTHQKAVASYRINPFKDLGGIAFAGDAHKLPWSDQGYTLAERPQFIFDPIFHAGGYYVQEASSMFLEQALKQHLPNGPLTVLDLCAAPGGKSTHILSLLPENSLLFSNEVIKSRVPVLAENITKWGVCNAAVIQNDAADLGILHHQFDVIVTDAPCSGSGLFRKDAGAAEEWSEANVQLCSQRQKRILADIWPALKPGGLFIYATCSYSPEENEQVCDWLVNEFDPQPLSLTVDESWGITTVSTHKNATGYRFWPHKLTGEGFFMACFMKTGSSNVNKPFNEKRSRPHTLTPINKNDRARLPAWIVNNNPHEFYSRNGQVICMPQQLEQLLSSCAVLNIRMAGCTFGKIIGSGLVPDHALAMNAAASASEQFSDLDLRQALRFLKKENFDAGIAAKGWYLARYQQYNLGWFKHLGNRVNNYYPAELRILKALPG